MNQYHHRVGWSLLDVGLPHIDTVYLLGSPNVDYVLWIFFDCLIWNNICLANILRDLCLEVQVYCLKIKITSKENDNLDHLERPKTNFQCVDSTSWNFVITLICILTPFIKLQSLSQNGPQYSLLKFPPYKNLFPSQYNAKLTDNYQCYRKINLWREAAESE